MELNPIKKGIALSAVILSSVSFVFADANADLTKAVMSHDVPGIKTAIAAGANVNNPDASGNSVLFGAVWWPDAVQALVDAKADVNLKNKVGSTPLMSAAMQGEPESIKILLAAGADVKAVNNAGQSALWLGSLCGCNATALKEMIDAGADPNQKDASGMTCLYTLVQGSKTPAEQVALVKSQTPYFQKAGLVLNHRFTDPKESDYSSIGDMVTVLINAKADVNATIAPANVTAMMMAAKNGRNDAVIALINAKADVKAKSVNGWTALWLCADDINCQDAAIALIAAGADVNTIVPIGGLVQKNGVKGKTTHVTNWHGGTIDLDFNGDLKKISVLMVACKEGSAKLVKALIDAKVDLTPVCEGGFNDGENFVTISMSALSVAYNFGHDDVVKLLTDAKSLDVSAAGKKTKKKK